MPAEQVYPNVSSTSFLTSRIISAAIDITTSSQSTGSSSLSPSLSGTIAPNSSPKTILGAGGSG